jgi:hypothetical protein
MPKKVVYGNTPTISLDDPRFAKVQPADFLVKFPNPQDYLAFMRKIAPDFSCLFFEGLPYQPGKTVKTWLPVDGPEKFPATRMMIRQFLIDANGAPERYLESGEYLMTVELLGAEEAYRLCFEPTTAHAPGAAGFPVGVRPIPQRAPKPIEEYWPSWFGGAAGAWVDTTKVAPTEDETKDIVSASALERIEKKVDEVLAILKRSGA